jgi:hypothetical protein
MPQNPTAQETALDHLPRVPGRTEGKLNNWWAYVCDFNRYPESR